jgi:hypothetical protein
MPVVDLSMELASTVQDVTYAYASTVVLG